MPSVLLVSIVAGAVLVGPVTVSSAAPACQSWSVQPPNVGVSDNSLRGVALTTGCVAFAVGYSTDSGFHRALVERWNGTAWKVQPFVNVGSSSELAGVAAVSSKDAWAVGVFDSGGPKTYVLHWNGGAWTMQSSAAPGIDSSLAGVAALSASNAWAVGRFASTGDYRTLILGWNGTAWVKRKSPNVGAGRNELRSVTAVSAKNIWAVGRYFEQTANAFRTLILHWNGRGWKHVPSPNTGAGDNELTAVFARSADDAWAVGDSFGPPYHNLILHWNGTRWKKVTSPNVGAFENKLFGVTATSAGNAWAVGHFQDPISGNFQGLILHWNGSAWKVESKVAIGDTSNLWAIAATSAVNAWSVGDYAGTSDQTLALHCC